MNCMLTAPVQPIDVAVRMCKILATSLCKCSANFTCFDYINCDLENQNSDIVLLASSSSEMKFGHRCVETDCQFKESIRRYNS